MMGSVPTPEINEKVLRYESFINDVLKERLKVIHFQWDKRNSDMAEWIQLKTCIQSFESLEMKSFKGKMDIGSNIYAQVYVPDTSKIIVNVGAGIHIEYTLPEALKFVNYRINLLEKELELIKGESCSVKARIKLVLHGIEELQTLN